jgi:hypothetical protein
MKHQKRYALERFTIWSNNDTGWHFQYSSAALRRYDRRHGVNHYLLSPSSNLSFAKYPSTENEQSIGLGPLPIEQSLESKIFGWDRDDAPPAVLHRAPPNPWKFPIVDAPLVINPRILVRNTAARTLNFSTARLPLSRLPSSLNLLTPFPFPSSLPHAQQYAFHSELPKTTYL